MFVVIRPLRGLTVNHCCCVLQEASMTFKKTSEYGLVFPRSVRPPGALLADFDIDGAILKRDHKLWLEENVIAPAKAKPFASGHWQISLIGRASKSGSDAHNMTLSGKRVNAVEAYLGSKMSGVPFHFAGVQLGESSSFKSDEYDYELDRSVEIIAKFNPVSIPKRIKPPVILVPKIHIWKPRPNRKVMAFKLQVLKAQISIRTLDVKLGLLEVGMGDARVKIFMDIREVGSTDHALYEYVGEGRGMIVGAGLSLKKVLPGLGFSDWSETYEKGDPHSFATDVEMDADGFVGAASFQFDLASKKFSFGPTSGLFGPSIKIRDLSFGMTKDNNMLKYAEATTFGEMSIVESAPWWAK